MAPEALAALAALCREAGLEPPVAVEGAPFGYRLRARLAVRGRASSPKIGIFQEGSHRITDIPRCPIHHPRVNEVAAALKHAIRTTGTPPYVERSQRGLVRYLQVVVERPSGRVQVVVVANGDDPGPLRPLLGALAGTLDETLHSLWWNGNPARANTILGPHWERLAGAPAIMERIGGASVFFPPGAFGQANLDLADDLVARVASWVPDGSRVVEYHAGAGAIGLGLVPRLDRITFNEVSPAALDGLALGIEALPTAVRARVVVLAGAAGDQTAAVRDADVVIADPPRKGLERPLLDALATHLPHRLVYVSCNLAPFLREARVLRAAGLALRALVPVALFPHTDHVETVALFERA